jgi:hypothetical protein
VYPPDKRKQVLCIHPAIGSVAFCLHCWSMAFCLHPTVGRWHFACTQQLVDGILPALNSRSMAFCLHSTVGRWHFARNGHIYFFNSTIKKWKNRFHQICEATMCDMSKFPDNITDQNELKAAYSDLRKMTIQYRDLKVRISCSLTLPNTDRPLYSEGKRGQGP